jgi:hypothetical protein
VAMQVIGIFGDSWASHTMPNTPGIGWQQIVKEHYDGPDYFVDNYARPGSSLYFSYENFLVHHHKFDKIIFVVTSSGRLLLPDGLTDNVTRHVNTYFTANSLLKKLPDDPKFDKDRKILETAVAYFTYIYDINEHRHYSRLMIEEIRRIRPDALIVPTTVDERIPGFEHPCLHEIINEVELTYWGITGDDIESLVELRSCHMSKENNEIFAKKIITWIDTGHWTPLSIDEFVNPLLPWKEYFK